RPRDWSSDVCSSDLGFQPVQACRAVGQKATQRPPLYEAPAAASNDVREGRGALELLLEQSGALVGDGEEAEDAIVVGDGLADRGDAAITARPPRGLPR